jgi:hypothetical protein
MFVIQKLFAERWKENKNRREESKRCLFLAKKAKFVLKSDQFEVVFQNKCFNNRTFIKEI